MEIVKKKITDYVGEGGRGVAKDYVKDYVGGGGGSKSQKKRLRNFWTAPKLKVIYSLIT